MQTLKWEKTLKKRPYMRQNHQSSSFNNNNNNNNNNNINNNNNNFEHIVITSYINTKLQITIDTLTHQNSIQFERSDCKLILCLD